MTNTVTYPSELFPAPVGISLPQPDGWEPLTVAEALVALGKAGIAQGQFQPNVVVTNRRSVDVTLDDAATATADALQTAPEWEETGREIREAFGGLRSFRIEGAFVHPQAGTVYQAALITVVPRGPYTDVVQVVGSCSAAQTIEVLPDIRAILQGAVVSE